MRKPSALLVAWLAGGLLVGSVSIGAAPARGPVATAAATPLLFSDHFDGPDALLLRSATRAGAEGASRWIVTSGSLFRRNGAAWTGPPDGGAAGPSGARQPTGSAVFRLRTRRSDFGDVSVSFSLRTLRLVETSRTPPVAWDGVHVWLRYQSPFSLYAVSVNRRDHAVVVKKKCPGGPSNDGTYFTLAESEPYPDPSDSLQRVTASIRRLAGGAQRIQVDISGTTVADVVDSGLGCPVIAQPGAVGVRGDNAEFLFDDFEVRGQPPGSP